VQVNYRGSTGYGKGFVNAGDREWAGKMHDDLLDAVAHVTGQGWADPDRVAIYGGSYGGYAALVGATFTPDVFRCAVDIVGPSNLKTLIETVPPYWAPMIAQFHRRLGDPEKDADFLWSRSPLSRASAIRIPLLIAQGANDPRVKRAESDQIVKSMKDKNLPVTYVLYPDEGHGFARPENRRTATPPPRRFLAKHLGGRSGLRPATGRVRPADGCGWWTRRPRVCVNRRRRPGAGARAPGPAPAPGQAPAVGGSPGQRADQVGGADRGPAPVSSWPSPRRWRPPRPPPG
jgi:dienelactone hydrolase